MGSPERFLNIIIFGHYFIFNSQRVRESRFILTAQAEVAVSTLGPLTQFFKVNYGYVVGNQRSRLLRSNGG